MRILIYSDVHANWEALTAMAGYVGTLGPEAACGANLCLGDVVGYGASPNEACEWVRAHTPVAIRGNHDRAAAALYGLEWFNPAAAAAAHWTHERLSAEFTAWLNALPQGPLAWNELSLVHGSPLDEDEYLTSLEQAARVFTATSGRLQWFGHTHLQGGFEWSEGQAVEFLAARPEERAQPGMLKLELRPGARYLLNPGSVGQPRDGDWRAAFAILDEEAAAVEFHRVPYDLAGAQSRILEAGLPARLAERLAAGK